MNEPSLADRLRFHYVEENREDARLRSGHGRLELWRAQEIVRRYLGPAPQRVLDLGGASGVHAEWLLEDGHHVHLVDLLDHHVEQATARLGGHERFTAQAGDARDLPLPDASADTVVMFGPLYHLLERADRVAAWREAARVVVPGGVVVAMVISRFASLFDGLTQEYLFDDEFRRIAFQDLATGRHENPEDRPGWFTTAYFHRPEEVADEAHEAGLEVEAVLGVEGIADWLRHLGPRLDVPAQRDTVLAALRAVEAEPSVIGASPHLIAVGRRPAAGEILAPG